MYFSTHCIIIVPTNNIIIPLLYIHFGNAIGLIINQLSDNLHSKTICEIWRDTTPYNSIINSIYTVDKLRIQTGSDTESVFCVDGVYDGVIRCCISPYFTYGFAVLHLKWCLHLAWLGRRATYVHTGWQLLRCGINAIPTSCNKINATTRGLIWLISCSWEALQLRKGSQRIHSLDRIVDSRHGYNYLEMCIDINIIARYYRLCMLNWKLMTSCEQPVLQVSISYTKREQFNSVCTVNSAESWKF